jgi:hypothetical protein
MNKADALFRMFSPELPEFPLSEDIKDELETFEGRLPTNLNNWARLLTVSPENMSDPSEYAEEL